MEYDPFAATCPSRQVLDRIGDRWAILIVLALDDGPLRFSQVRDRVAGISEKMLSQHTKELVRHGLMTRTQHATIPPRVDYELTPLGCDLARTLLMLERWTREHTGEVLSAVAAFDGEMTG